MAAHQTAVLGRVPQPSLAQDGAPRTVTTGGSAPHPRSGQHAAAVTGATYRQIDWWARHGLLGDHQCNLGSGKRRSFDDADLEVIHAYQQLASIGCRDQWLATAGATVRSRRVRAGEWLLLTIDGHAARTMRQHSADEQPSWVIRLQPFADGRPQ